MHITVNGTVDDLSGDTTIRDYLATRNLREEIIIIAVNGEVTARESWGSTVLKPGDSIEIIQVVGGG